LRGPANGGGWDFELGARLAYDLNQPLDLSSNITAGSGRWAICRPRTSKSISFSREAI
jgi:hypothetical protein